MSTKPVRVRFAPSPTGFLHIGGLRTALYNYLYARRQGGDFLLRIEDTDRTRYVAEAEKDIIEMMEWAGFDYDEGPNKDGGCGPYYQSERKETYDKYAKELINSGHAYYAFDTPAEIDEMRTRLQASGSVAPRYDLTTRDAMKNSLTMSAVDVAKALEAGDPFVVRLKVEAGKSITFDDQIRGHVSFEPEAVDDQVLVKSDGMPTYHLANIVDDHLMGITHVIRGEEWLSSTPKHILMYEFFGWEAPTMAHLPLILSPTGGKLSKRNADKLGIPVSVIQYKEAGYEPEALINFLAFLGWNPGDDREVMSMKELEEAFDPSRIGSAGIQFNLDKLSWYNEQYIRMMTPAELAKKSRPSFETAGIEVEDDLLETLAALMQERLKKVSDLADMSGFFFNDPTEYDPKGVKKQWKEATGGMMSQLADKLAVLDDFVEANIKGAITEVAEANEFKPGKLFAPFRLSVCGVMAGPDLMASLQLLGKETVVRRLHNAVEKLG